VRRDAEGYAKSNDRKPIMQADASHKVLAQAATIFGDIERAKEWYFNYPLPEFGGQTAEAAVAYGREAEVLCLLEMYDAGSLG
jgi:hypothetical protein